MSDGTPAKRLVMVARGGAFLALLLGLVLFADAFVDVLGGAYLAVVGVHVAIGALAIVVAYVTLVPFLRAGGARPRLRTTAVAAAAVLAVLLASGALLIPGALGPGNAGPGRLVHLVFGFGAIAALVAVGLAAKASASAA